MVIAFAALLVVHGLIHLLGVAKAFGIADLQALRQPITPVMGGMWLIAALLFFTTAVSLFAWPRAWWMIGAAAVVVSVTVIVSSWSDAKFGLIANVIVAAAIAFRITGVSSG